MEICARSGDGMLAMLEICDLYQGGVLNLVISNHKLMETNMQKGK